MQQMQQPYVQMQPQVDINDYLDDEELDVDDDEQEEAEEQWERGDETAKQIYQMKSARNARFYQKQ